MDGSPNLCEAEVKVRVGPARYGQKGGRTEPTRVGCGCERTSTTGALRQGAGLEHIPDRL